MSPDEFRRHIDFTVNGVRHAAGDLPLYAVDSWRGPVMIGNWGWENDVLTHAGLIHGTPESDVRVEVKTTLNDVRREAARMIGLAVGLKPGQVPDYKERKRVIREEPGSEVSLAVDGKAVPFTLWGGDTRWWAAGHVDDVGVVIEARNYSHADLRLTTTRSVDPYISGWQSHVLAYRGE